MTYVVFLKGVINHGGVSHLLLVSGLIMGQNGLMCKNFLDTIVKLLRWTYEIISLA